MAMEYFTINHKELSALNGLPFLQRLVYLQGLRPYVDYQTGIVGIKRGVSYQSLAEVLYIEPHPGIQSGSPSKDQLRRALKGLFKAGLLESLCTDKQLIFKCPLVDAHRSVQNKLATKPPYQAATLTNEDKLGSIRDFNRQLDNPAIVQPLEAAIPLDNNNYYIFLFKQFEKFWELYPVKKSQQHAWKIFQELNPSATLIEQILSALQAQLDFTQQQQAQGLWVPNWKNPANWLAQQCWADELTNHSQDVNYATHEKSYAKPAICDPLWNACQAGEDAEYSGAENEPDNVIQFPKCANESEAY